MILRSSAHQRLSSHAIRGAANSRGPVLMEALRKGDDSASEWLELIRQSVADTGQAWLFESQYLDFDGYRFGVGKQEDR